MFLFDKEKLSLFKSFRALNKASYQDGGYWKHIFKFLHFLRSFSNLIYTQLLSYDNNSRRLELIILIKYFRQDSTLIKEARNDLSKTFQTF